MKHALKLVAMVALSASLSGCWQTGEGDKTGFIVKVATEGSFHDTWEAEMIRGGYNNGTGAVGDAFHFTIEDPALLAKVQEAATKNLEVKVHYKTEKFAAWRSQRGNNFLTSVEILHPAASTQAVGEVSSAVSRNVAKIKELLRVQAQLIEELAK